MRNIIIIFILNLMTLSAIAGNVVSVSELSGVPGETVKLRLQLSNSEPISALQIDIPIPQGADVSVAGEPSSLGYASNHSVSAGIDNGNLRIMLYSLSLNSIAVGEGEIAIIPIMLGQKPISATLQPKVIATDADGSTVNCTASSFQAIIYASYAVWGMESVDFGRVPIHSTHTIQLPVRNSGTDILRIADVTLSNEAMHISNPLPVEIAPNGSTNIELVFSPEKRGEIFETISFDCNSPLTRNLIEITGKPYAINELTIGNTSGVSDSEVEIPITLKNMDAINGFSFEFDLPLQLEYVDDSFTLDPSRTSDHQVITNYSDKHLIVNCYSLTNASFTGNEGVIATFKVKLQGKSGTYLNFAKAILPAYVDGELIDVLSDTYQGYISISYPSISVSGSHYVGRTPITESHETTLNIYNGGSVPLTIDKAFVDGEHVSIIDLFPLIISARESKQLTLRIDDLYEGKIEETLQIYSNDPDRRLVNISLEGERFAPNELYLSDTEAYSSRGMVFVPLQLENYYPISALQFDLEIDGMINPEEEITSTERSEGYSLMIRKIDDNHYRYFIFTTDGGAINPGDGAVAMLKFTFPNDVALKNYTLKLTNILLSTPEMVNKYSGDSVKTSILTMSDSSAYTMGDVNGDGMITGLDASLTRAYFLGRDPSEFNFNAADMNTDGVITGLDISMITGIFLEKEN